MCRSSDQKSPHSCPPTQGTPWETTFQRRSVNHTGPNVSDGEKARIPRAKLASVDFRGRCLAHLRRVCFLCCPGVTTNVKCQSRKRSSRKKQTPKSATHTQKKETDHSGTWTRSFGDDKFMDYTAFVFWIGRTHVDSDFAGCTLALGHDTSCPSAIGTLLSTLDILEDRLQDSSFRFH